MQKIPTNDLVRKAVDRILARQMSLMKEMVQGSPTEVGRIHHLQGHLWGLKEAADIVANIFKDDHDDGDVQ